MKEKILEISDKLRNEEITENEAQKQFLFLFGVTNSLTSKSFQIQADTFLRETEINDKDKPVFMTKNHVPILHQSINEFFIWLKKNYW